MTEDPDLRHTQTVDPLIMDDLRQMENAPAYNAWLHALVQPFLGTRILEVGPGTGNITRLLLPSVEAWVGVEPNPHCRSILARQIHDLPQHAILPHSVEECSPAELAPYRFDTVLCMNVLEHIQDDAATLRLFAGILGPGGRVVLLVPAVPLAYGPLDKAIGHFRRYTPVRLKQAVSGASLSIETMFSTNFLALLGWMYNARIRKATRQSDAQIRFFNRLVPALAFLEKRLGCPVGQSLVCSARVQA